MFALWGMSFPQDNGLMVKISYPPTSWLTEEIKDKKSTTCDPSRRTRNSSIFIIVTFKCLVCPLTNIKAPSTQICSLLNGTQCLSFNAQKYVLAHFDIKNMFFQCILEMLLCAVRCPRPRWSYFTTILKAVHSVWCEELNSLISYHIF